MKAAGDALLHADQADYLERMLAPRDDLLLRMEERARERRYPISDPARKDKLRRELLEAGLPQ